MRMNTNNNKKKRRPRQQQKNAWMTIIQTIHSGYHIAIYLISIIK